VTATVGDRLPDLSILAMLGGKKESQQIKEALDTTPHTFLSKFLPECLCEKKNLHNFIHAQKKKLRDSRHIRYR
jgi:hypothetical protein